MTPIPSEPFGDYVRNKRMEKGVTLRKLADMLGVSATFLSKVERNELTPPSLENIQKLAKLLDVPENILLSLAGKIENEMKEAVLDLLHDKPNLTPAFFRKARQLSHDQLEQMIKDIPDV
ncbi:MAG: helix-turn-helix transcriptional regulator [Vampirovibrionales bacterium]|nr:helix-turn-helix transcriptional regulator [Vampirovibrionales bacterium]